MHLSDCVELVSLFLVSASQLKLLLPLNFLNSDFDLVDFVNNPFFPPHKRLVLLSLVEVLLLESKNVSLLLLDEVLEVLDLMDVGVNCIIEVSVHEVQVLAVASIPILEVLEVSMF